MGNLPNRKEDMERILKKYQEKLEKDLNIKKGSESKPITSREYSEFKKQYLPKPLSFYEKMCTQSEELLKFKVDSVKEKELNEAIAMCHLNITPSGVASLALLSLFGIILIGALFSFLFSDFFFLVFFAIAALAIYLPLSELPKYIAASWRMKASNQMVLSVFYVVTYMRHTSNLELAIDFAAEHLSPPLSLDLKKLVWDVQTEKYSSIKEGLDIYLEGWKKWNMEFIEAFHLIESSLYEGNEQKRVELLEKSLSVMLEETYEKMLHYAQDLKSPITMLHMMGIVLPILGLVVLPLIVSFMPQIQWYHIAILYNVTLPIGLYFLGKNILATRPTGYGETDISKYDSKAKEKEDIVIKFGKDELRFTPLSLAVTVGAIFMLIGLSPIIMHIFLPNDFDYVMTKDGEIMMGADVKNKADINYEFLGYRCPKTSTDCNSDIRGPYGLGATLLGLLIPLGLGLAIGIYFKIKTGKLLEIRNKAKKLEQEFASALFQLGNRLGDGIPAELAFTKVSQVMDGTITGEFFKLVELNIRRLGVDVEKAIFDPKYGALVSYPSSLIESSMKVLAQSVRKGPRVASVAMINVSNYIKEMHRVDERLRDLMSDIISDMKMQTAYITPVIAGVVIGITSMITTIIGKLSTTLNTVSANGGTGGLSSLLTLFSDGIPTYYFQIIVGLYVVQVIFILSILANGIENGADELGEEKVVGENVSNGVILYCTIAFIVILIFNLIAGQIIENVKA